MGGLQKILDSVQQTSLNNAEKLDKAESLIRGEQLGINKAIAGIGKRIDNVELHLAEWEVDKKENDIIAFQGEAAAVVQDAQERVAELARAYKDGKPIDFMEIESPRPSQKVHLIARTLHQWRIQLEQSDQTDPSFIQVLTSAEEVVRQKLKVIRGESTPSPRPFDLETDISTKTELNRIRNQCIDYIARFKGTLYGLRTRA